MPYDWIDPAERDRGDPVTELRLWPHRSLPRHGFVTFIAITCALIAVPLIAVIGSPVLWGVLPFFAITIWAVWAALARSYRDGELLEVLTFAQDGLRLVRTDPRGQRREWQADPYWVELDLHEEGGPVPAYLTLKGGGRVVEIGAFLSEDERRELAPDLRQALARARAPARP